MRHVDLYEADETRIAYHGSPNKFDAFSTSDVFLAKSAQEAKRYGQYIYEVTFSGKPMFETPTIMVIAPTQVVNLDIIEYDKKAVIYRT